MNDTSTIPMKETRKINPQLFLLWGAIVSSCMIFAGLTSGYIVRQADPGWMSFELPALFKISTVAIVLSSITFHWSFLQAKKNNLAKLKIGLFITFIFGLSFLVCQLLAFDALTNIGIFLDTNPSSSFLYVICLMHALHMVAGIFSIIYTFVSALRLKIHSQNMLGLKMASIFWHFMGLIWVYLFIFLTVNG